MSFVQRDAQGHIVGIFAALQPGVAEEQVDNPTLWEAPSPFVDFLTFVALFTTSEQTAIFASADAKVKQFIAMSAGAPNGLSLTDPRVTAGVNYLASQGLITADRVAAVLAGTQAA